MYKINSQPKDEELTFIIKTVLFLVASNYAKFKCKNITNKLISNIKNHFKRNFGFNISTHDDMEDFVITGAKLIKIFNLGYAIFSINLIIKRMGMLIDPKYVVLLDAPLNSKELSIIKSPVKRIKDINDKNYKSVMTLARQFAKNKTLYEWELEEYNK